MSGKPDARLYIWDVEMDTIQFFNFESGLSEQDELVTQSNESEKDMSAEDRCVNCVICATCSKWRVLLLDVEHMYVHGRKICNSCRES